MVLWGVVWGAILGLLWPGWDGAEMVLGAVLGALAGWSLRKAVRSEVARAAALVPPATPVAAPVPTQAQPDFAPTEQVERGVDLDLDVADTPSHVAIPASAARRTPDVSVATAPAPRPAAPPAAPAVPRKPSIVEQAAGAARNWLLGGNTIVRVGLVILFIGLTFLARYAAVAGLFPLELRLATVGAAGVALLAVGFGRRLARPGFALALQGGGVAVLYLTVFAASRLYGLLPELPAFGLMIVVCALSCALALLQNARVLAVAAFAGGFAVPVLLSTGQGNHVGLFSYYLVLNLAILFIAARRSWRVLNLLGFLATFGVATTWGVLHYHSGQYASTQPFLVAFVLVYVAAAVLYARNTPTPLGNAVDSTLVFGTPLVAFGLQVGLVQHLHMGSAFSALAFGALYLLLALVLSRRGPPACRLLVECFTAVGVGFATLAVPLALDAQWTSAVWALEGAGAFWVGMRQARWMPRLFGLLLQAAAMLTFSQLASHQVWALALLNPRFMGALLIALPALLLAWWLRQPLPHGGSRWAQLYAKVEAELSSPVYLYGFVFWCLAWLTEVRRATPALESGGLPVPVFTQSVAQLLAMLVLVLSAALSFLLGRRLQWPVASVPARATLGVMGLTLFGQISMGHHVLDFPGWAIWPVALVLHYTLLRQLDRQDAAPASTPASAWPQWARAVHVGGVWLGVLLLADMLWVWIERAALWHTAWATVVLLVSLVLVLGALVAWAGRASQVRRLPSLHWPLNPHAMAYYWLAALPIAALLLLATLVTALTSSGQTAPLPYVPLLNPTDLALGMALAVLLLWRRMLQAAQPQPRGAAAITGPAALGGLGLLAFVAINTVWLRIAHHFFGVRWDAGALFDSFVVQTGYAILWTLMAFSLMVLAHRRVHRSLWLVGAGLLGLVVVKLLLVDLSNVGGVERIITFIAVGVMMLVVGYFAPLPPKPHKEAP
jgi:uncharacterized membrane protein